MRIFVTIALMLTIINIAWASALPVSSESTLLQPCGVINAPHLIDYPVDRFEFQVISPFGRPSGRYDGQLHAADDWIKIEGPSLGEPVHAIGPGRVTYANPTGWGRDRGVVIIEHVLADGTYFYSLYGHIDESEIHNFPARGSCVNLGDVVGVIADPRPAPHLHFEIRNFGPAAPGPGYSEIDPRLSGWFNPRQFIDNAKAWLSPAYRWHIEAGDDQGLTPSPVLTSDGSLILIDGQYLEVYSDAGQLLWRYRMADTVEPVGLATLADDRLFVGAADGRLQYWSPQAGYLEQWETGLSAITLGPIVFSDLIVVMDDAQMLHIFNANRESIASYADLDDIRAYAVTERMVGILTEHDLLLIGLDGQLIARFEVERNSDVIASPDGGLFVRNQGELAQISSAGEWRTITNALSANRSDNQMMFDQNTGNIILWGITRPNRLIAISLQGEIVWETDLHQYTLWGLSRAALIQANRCTGILASQRGYVLAFDLPSGQLTGQLHMWGQHRTNVWLGKQPGDPVLRVQIADQIMGLDVSTLSSQACNN